MSRYLGKRGVERRRSDERVEREWGESGQSGREYGENGERVE